MAWQSYDTQGKGKKPRRIRYLRRYSQNFMRILSPFTINDRAACPLTDLFFSVPASLPNKITTKSLTPKASLPRPPTPLYLYLPIRLESVILLDSQIANFHTAHTVPSVTSNALPFTLALSPPLRPPIRPCTPASRTLQVSASLARFVKLVDTSPPIVCDLCLGIYLLSGLLVLL